MGTNETEWNRMERNGTEWNGTERFLKSRKTPSLRAGCCSWGTIILSRDQMDRNGTEWNGMEQNETEWSGTERLK